MISRSDCAAFWLLLDTYVAGLLAQALSRSRCEVRRIRGRDPQSQASIICISSDSKRAWFPPSSMRTTYPVVAPVRGSLSTCVIWLVFLRRRARGVWFLRLAQSLLWLGEGACDPSANRRFPWPRTSYATMTDAGPNIILGMFRELRVNGVLGSRATRGSHGQCLGAHLG